MHDTYSNNTNKSTKLHIKLVKIPALCLYTVLSLARIATAAAWARIRRKKLALIIATPIHSNLGDHAIALAEHIFLEQNLRQYKVIETRLVTQKILNSELALLRRIVQKDDVIFGIGGGNMGDEYPHEEHARCSIISSFPNNRVVIFPQTFYYNKSASAAEMLKKVKSIYSAHPALTLVAREETSYELMQKELPKNNISLAPDIVLFLRKHEPQVLRVGAMTCLRNDVEKTLPKKYEDQIIKTLKDKFGQVKTSDTISNKKIIITERLRKSELTKTWEEFKSSEIVVTDRLHGMVFAAITGTPCVVFTSYNHKVSGTYKWIDKLPHIYLCQKHEDLENAIEKVMSAPIKEVDDFSKHWSRMLEGVV